jgi:hypothetical protein
MMKVHTAYSILIPGITRTIKNFLIFFSSNPPIRNPSNHLGEVSNPCYLYSKCSHTCFLCRHRVNILYIVILRTISAFSFWYMGIMTNTYGSLKCPPVEAEVPPIEFCHKPSVHKTEISTLELPCEISLRDLSPQNTQIKQELKSSNVCTRCPHLSQCHEAPNYPSNF